MRLFQLGAGVGGCRVCNQSVFLAQRLLISGHLFHRTCFKCARCSALLSVANYYETQDGKYCCETCPDEERTVSPTVSSTTAATTTPQSQQPSLVGDRRALFETLAAADCTDDVKASKKAQRPVTLKMVDPLTTTTAAAAAAEKSAVTCSDDNDSGVVVDSDKKESSDAKTSASVTGSRETLSDVVAVVADEDGESALPPPSSADDRVTDNATAAVVVSDQLPDVGGPPVVVESSPPTLPLSDDSKRPDDEIVVEPLKHVQIPPISDDLKQVLELPPASKAPAEEQLESPEDYEIKTLSNKLLKMDYYESNKEVPVPSPRKRIKSPIKTNYPENLNPFDDEEDDGNNNKNDSTNPFGSDFEDEELSVKKNVSLNPFSSDEDDNEPVSQPPLPKPR